MPVALRGRLGVMEPARGYRQLAQRHPQSSRVAGSRLCVRTPAFPHCTNPPVSFATSACPAPSARVPAAPHTDREERMSDLSFGPGIAVTGRITPEYAPDPDPRC